jgi:hypothetical protein
MCKNMNWVLYEVFYYKYWIIYWKNICTIIYGKIKFCQIKRNLLYNIKVFLKKL